MYDFGMLLKELREKNGYTQAQLAEKINRSKTVICKYESNTLSPTFETMKDFAAIFNVSLDYLAGYEKQAVLVLNGLTEKRAMLVRELADSLRTSSKSSASPLSTEQNALIFRILSEYIEINGFKR